MKLFFLSTYAIVMCFICYRSFHNKRNIVFCMMWFIYALSSVFCVLSSIFQHELIGSNIWVNRWYNLSDTTWWGYLLIIICCAIAFRPFAAINRFSSFADFGQNKEYKQFFILFSYVYIFCTFIFILFSFSTIIDIVQIDDFGVRRRNLFDNRENESTFVMANNVFASISYKLCLHLKYLSIFISMAMLKEKLRPRLAVLLYSSSFFIWYLTTVANAARGGLMIYFFCTLLIGLLFFKFLPQKQKRLILIFSAVLCAIVFSFFIKVTLDRFSHNITNTDSPLKYIAFYLGHGPIEFSKITGSLDKFAMGDAIIGRLMNHYFEAPYNWDLVQSRIGYPPIGPVFTTYLGFIYTDFGVVGCLVFITLWSNLVLYLVKNKQNCISTSFLLGYYMYYFTSGVFGIGRLEYAAVITTHIIYICFIYTEEVLLKLKVKNKFAIIKTNYHMTRRLRLKW